MAGELMAHLEDVHVLEMDRATTRLECVRINPTRTFGARGPMGTAFYTWQNGKWFGAGGQEMALADVPQECQDLIAGNTPTVESRGPAVVVTCEFCGQQMNRSEKEAHLVEHVRKTLAGAGLPKPADIPPPPPPAPGPTHPSTTTPPHPRPGERARRDAPDAA